jgi:pyridoxal 5'-phosphate synthase pdxS subunit
VLDHTHYKDPGKIAEVVRGAGEAMPGLDVSKMAEAELMQTRGL